MNNEKPFSFDKHSKEFICGLYGKYRKEMIRLAYSKLNDWHEAEDAVEEAFIKVAKNYQKLINSEDYEVKKYLVNTVVNTSYKILDKKNADYCGDMYTFEDNLSFVEGAEDTVFSDISYDDLKFYVDKLKPRSRLLLNMKSMGYSNREIAEELNVKPDSIRVMLLRIRESFKNFKEGDLNEGSRSK